MCCSEGCWLGGKLCVRVVKEFVGNLSFLLNFSGNLKLEKKSLLKKKSKDLHCTENKSTQLSRDYGGDRIAPRPQYRGYT